ncbi:MAG: hypothetical protein IPJ82_05895 [Lewinellaceae bacterium]|nr:hypothetical protein [Lewinellaceae bacterium]
MKTLLLVPVQTDALYLSEDTLITEASVDFSRLPYFNGTRDVNADVANISESFVSQPLQDQNLRLRKGLHLHWALPDALNRGRHRDDGKTDFPLVPNRWLVTRTRGGVVKTWVVESDYLFPEEKDLLQLPDNDPLRLARRESVTMPMPIAGRESGQQPFRYMGRKVDGDKFNPGQAADRYPELTTVGYGEPSFAAFYPNCHSVFGFHDPEIGENSGPVTYDIIGWYGDPANDFYKKLSAGIASTELAQHLRDRAGWVLSPAGTAAPDQTLLYSRIEVNTTGIAGKLPQGELEGLSVVIGNTGTEALSVYLAKQLEQTWTGANGKALNIEEQLEALYLRDKLDHRVLDLDAKFDEARHENGFNSLAGGYLWTITAESGANQPADARQAAEKPGLSAELAGLLNAANSLQSEYDRALLELQSLGAQLYVDWYKYMVSTYPPEDTRVDYPEIDEVRYFIGEQVTGPIRAREQQTGRLILATAAEIAAGALPARAENNDNESVAARLAAAINNLLHRLTVFNEAQPDGSDVFVLKRTGGPRYWEPKEPVVLLANDTAGNSVLRPTDRHGRDGRLRPDGLLECPLVSVADVFDGKNTAVIAEIRGKINELTKPASGEKMGFTRWTGQPWNPFRLDWEVELAPLSQGTNMEERDYDPDFLTKKYKLKAGSATVENPNFRLPVNAPDLVPVLDSRVDFQGRNPNIYTGRSLLTPQARRNLRERLEVYLKEKLLAPFLEKNPGHAAKISADPLRLFGREMAKALKIEGADNPVATALEAFFVLENNNLHLLSQAFSGFNSAMIQLRQTFQLPVTDPIGFKDYQPFTAEIAGFAENSTWLAPQPLTDFNPIRTGAMVINQLRLVDTFGQVRNIALGKIDRVLGSGPTPTLNAGSKIEVPLPPRLAQPARLHFRWLNATDGTQEMNTHPDTSPVCGWILTNQLDDSIVVYDAEGSMLGSIEAEAESGNPNLARWNPAPGARQPVQAEAIKNPFLNKIVAKLRAGGPAFVAQFLDGLDAAMSSIEPEVFESQQALSLLMGRPLALVRASLNLETMGAPAVDQGWNAFYGDRTDGNNDRNRDGFTKVKFPVRIGKHNQFNDGLVGYWKEKSGELDGPFMLNQLPLANITHKNIQPLNNDVVPIFQSIEDAPLIVSMLIDPRGTVHVTTGILPVKEVNVPTNQYLPAMQRLGVTFLTSPLLSPAGRIASLLPTEEGFDWSWLERRGTNDWRETFTFPTIERESFLRAFSDLVFGELLAKKWLAPGAGDSYPLGPTDDREGLNDQFQLVEADILTLTTESSAGNHLSKSVFDQKLFAPAGPGGRLWTLLTGDDIRWLKSIPDLTDTMALQPKSSRISQALPDFGMEFLVEDILQKHARLLQEPGAAAAFGSDSIWIREGWLKLS